MRMLLVVSFVLSIPSLLPGQDIKGTATYRRIKAKIDQIPAIDTHEHLRAFDEIPARVSTPDGSGMTLYSLWASSYFTRIHRVTPWPSSGKFEDWWRVARGDYKNARATSFYRYMLPAFEDLYGVDFDQITDEQAAQLNARIFANYRTDDWLHEVITERANIELMLVDPYWARMNFDMEYRFAVPVLNVTTLMRGSHPAQFTAAIDSPYEFARKYDLPTATFEDYLQVIRRIFQVASEAGCVCLKSTQAYQRDLSYLSVERERAAAGYGKSPEEISPAEQRAFEDFMFWQVCRLSREFDLPFQVHTGDARIQGSNPMLLVNVIEANPGTRFVLFHGGYPWVGETGAIAMKFRNVWIDSCWLPTISYTMARRAYEEWLDVVPSNRIMWGADTVNAEGIYAATEFTRRCVAEALAAKVVRGELREEHADQIGRQIMRDNALELFPKLRRRLWKE